MSYKIKNEGKAKEQLIDELFALRQRIAELEAAGAQDKKGEESLKESEELYRHLFENIPTGVYRTTPDGRILKANSALIGMLGYSSFEELSSINLEEGGYQPTYLRNQFKELLEREGEVRGLESKWTRCDGTEIFVRENARAIRGRDGAVMYYEGTVEDITERKRAEEERTRLQAIQQQFTSRLQKLANASLMINSALSLDEMLRLITERAREIIGAHQSVTSMTVDENWAQAINSVSLSDKYAAWREYNEKPDGSGIYSLVCRMSRSMRMTQTELEAHTAWRGFGKETGKHPPMRGWLAAPLVGRNGQNLGLIQLSDKYEDEFTEEDEAILVQIAQMASVAIENTRLYYKAQEEVAERKQAEESLKESLAQLSKKNRYETIISTVTRSVHQSINLQEVLDNAVESMSRDIDGVQFVSIYLIEGEEAILRAYRGYPDSYVERAGKIPYPRGATWKTITEGTPRYVPDVDQDTFLGPAGREAGIMSYVSMPIRSEGRTAGTLNITSSVKNAFDEEELKLLVTVAQQIEIAINNAQRAEALRQSEETLRQNFAQLSKKNRYETIISTVTRSAHQSINLQEVLDNAVEAMGENIDRVDGGVSIFLVEEQEAVLSAYRGYPDWFIERVRRIPYPRGLTWKAIIDGKPIYCADVDKDAVIGPAGREMGTKSHLSMPIRYEGKIVGCININSLQKNAFDEEELKLVETVAQQIETAINNAQQAEALRQSEDRYRKAKDNLEIKVKDLEILTGLIRAVNSSSSLEETYRVALGSVVALENVDMAAIYLIDEDKREAVLQAHRNFPEDYIRRAGRIPYPKGITWKVINTGRMLNVENAQKDPDIGPAGKDLGHNGVLGMPITLEERVIGVIWFVSYKERKFNEKEVNLLSALGDQIAIAIAKAKMFEEIRQREVDLKQSLAQLSKKNRYETIISTVTRSVHQSLNFQEVLENAVKSISENMESADRVGIYITEGNEAVLRAYRGYPDLFIERAGRIPYPKGFTWNTIIEGKPRYCADTEKDTLIGPAGREIGTKSYASMPIRYEGKTVGCININSLQKNAFDEEELKLLESVAQQIETAINNAKQTEALQESEERYRALYENNPSMYFTIDAEGKVLSVNRFGVEQLGYTAEELIGQPVHNVFYDDDKKAILEQLSRCLQDPGQIFQWELRKVRKDRSVLWVRENARAVRRAGGNIVAFIVCEDITERKRAEVVLRDSLDQLSKKNRYETIISTVTRSVNQSMNLKDILENAVESMKQNMQDADNVSIYMVEGGEAVIKAYRGYTDRFIKEAGRIPYPKGFTWKTIIDEKSRYCADVDQDTVIGPAGREMGTKSYLSMPIHYDRKIVGVININSFQENAFDEEELKLLEAVAGQIEIAINNAKQTEALYKAKEELELRVQERTGELAEMNVELRKEIDWRMRIEKALRRRTEKIIEHQKVLLEIARMDNSDPDSVLRRITEADAKTLSAERVSVWFFNEDRSAIVCKDLYKSSAGNHESGLRFRVKDHPAYFQALEESRILGSNDAWTDPRTKEFAEGYLKPLGITSMMDVPIRLHGNVVGVVCHEHVGAMREWTAEEQDFVASIADMVSLVIEASERRRAEEQVRASLKEKEVLLKEIHHRVKNNLQIISSLLNIQSGHINDKKNREKFRESQNRVKSMALIHELLYQSKDLAKIDFTEYIKKLSTHLIHSYRANSKDIKLNINVDNVFLSIDKAIPCGLIINEIVSNSIKHAFPTKEKGKIGISLYSDGSGNDPIVNLYHLIISNNGVKFPRDLDLRKTESVGLQLISALIDQLNGTIELNTRRGTEFKITFPASLQG